MKKLLSCLIILAMAFPCFTAYAVQTSPDHIFVPMLATAAYNDALGALYGVIFDDASLAVTAKQISRVSFLEQTGDVTVYSNANNTVVFLFTNTTDEHSTADSVTLFTSLEDDWVLGNIPQLAFAWAVCQLDTSCEFGEYGRWVNDANADGNGEGYEAEHFYAEYTEVPRESLYITLTKH